MILSDSKISIRECSLIFYLTWKTVEALVTYWNKHYNEVFFGINMTNKKVALITGITGQDGAYLAEFLLKKKRRVRMI